MWQDDFWIDLATSWATQSWCKKKQVGAVFVKDKQFIAAGVNGTVKGDSNCCEDSSGKTEHWRVVHAEMNAIANARDINDVRGSTLYINYFPCADCAKHLVQFGIERIVFTGEVKDMNAYLFCKRFMKDIVHVRR